MTRGEGALRRPTDSRNGRREGGGSGADPRGVASEAVLRRAPPLPFLAQLYLGAGGPAPRGGVSGGVPRRPPPLPFWPKLYSGAGGTGPLVPGTTPGSRGRIRVAAEPRRAESPEPMQEGRTGRWWTLRVVSARLN